MISGNKKEVLTTFFLPLIGLLTACTPHYFSSQDLENDDNYTKGSYRGSYYIVQEGDSLHYIAYITNKHIDDIITDNNIVDPDQIYTGQKLNLWHKSYIAPAYGVKQAQARKKLKTKSAPALATHNGADGYQRIQQNLTWLWPTKGKVISPFSDKELGNKGIDIEGQRGQAINASADGKVVYAGNALRGYGNLIIIKHNNNYLSAYAHNESLLVQESQTVKQGQKIASMGSSGTDTVRLHFEIRYKGKSVDPSKYLKSEQYTP